MKEQNTSIYDTRIYWPLKVAAVPSRLRHLVGQKIDGRWVLVRVDPLPNDMHYLVFGFIEYSTGLTVLEKDLLQ